MRIPLYKMSWRHRMDQSYISTGSLTSALEEIGCLRHGPIALTCGKDDPYPLTWRMCGLHGQSGRMRKVSASPDFKPRNGHPVACRYAACLPSGTAECYSYFGLPADGLRRAVTVPVFCPHFFAVAVCHLSLLLGSSSCSTALVYLLPSSLCHLR